MSEPTKQLNAEAAALLAFFDRPIAFHRALVDVVGSVSGALLLSQAIYWQRIKDRHGEPGSWFYKSAAEWLDETGMRRKEFEGARSKLVKAGVLDYEVRGVPATANYRVNVAGLSLHLSYKLDCTKGTNKIAPFPQTGLHESSKLPNVGTETTTETTAGRAARATRTQTDFELPDWIPIEAWQGFVEMRKKIRAPMTNRAQDLLVKTLDKLRASGQQPADVLNQSVENSWRGVFPLKAENGKPAQAPKPAPECTYVDRAGAEPCGMPNAKPDPLYGMKPICEHHHLKLAKPAVTLERVNEHMTAIKQAARARA